jgi:hypothetical protein
VADEKHKTVFDGTVHFKLKVLDGSGRAGTQGLEVSQNPDLALIIRAAADVSFAQDGTSPTALKRTRDEVLWDVGV